MSVNRNPEPPAAFNPADIYFVVFRHKWKILVLTLLGLAAAAALYFAKPPPYQSEAELLIQYVPVAGTLSLPGSDQKMIMPDSRGEQIINSEILILTSLDLAEQAATNLAATGILPKPAGSTNVIATAMSIHGGLLAEPADKGGSVIVVTFKHSNPQVVQPVLQEIINDYFQRHREIHSAGGQYDDVLSAERITLNNQLNDTEKQLADLKNQAGIVSLEDSRKSLADQISKTQATVLELQTELAGDVAAANLQASLSPEKPATTNTSSTGVVTNATTGVVSAGVVSAGVVSSVVTNAATTVVVPSDQMDAYKDICAQLEQARKQRLDYLGRGYTSSNTLVLEVETRITCAQETKSAFEAKYPQLTSIVIPAAATAGGQPVAPGLSAQDRAQGGQMQIAAVQARLKAWASQLDRLQMEATNLNNLAPALARLEQARLIQQANYQNLSMKLENSHVDEALDTGKTPNIKWVQAPSPPYQDWKKAHKLLAGVAVSGLLAGLLWAFLIEFFLDRSVKRPADVIIKLRMPFSLAIPDLNRQSRRQLAASARRQLAFNGSSNGHGSLISNGVGKGETASLGAPGTDPASSRNGNSPDPEGSDGALEVTPSSSFSSSSSPSVKLNPALSSHCDALRDRLVNYFESINLTRKPKLVALTSTGRGSGVSTISAGLAASLSETGDGRVLLVDMNREHGAALQFVNGQPGCQLDDALSSEKRDHALVQENLYVVSEGSNVGMLPRILPKRFAALMPKLRGSDYDYIIFDMPPVSQTSVTTRLAGFMDTVLLVIESEKTDSDVVQQANQLLLRSKTHVSAVLNKTRKYVPGWLQHDIENG